MARTSTRPGGIARHWPRTHGYRYIHSGDEPLLIAGVATETLEMLEDQPDLEVILLPVGGGSGAAGACIAAHAVNPAIRVSACRPSLAGRLRVLAAARR